MMMVCHMDSVQSPIHQQTDLRETLCMEKRMAVASSSSLMEGRHCLFDFSSAFCLLLAAIQN